jgi:hypothetical protein
LNTQIKILIVTAVLGIIIIAATPFIVRVYKSKNNQQSQQNQVTPPAKEPDKIWGATLRPYATGQVKGSLDLQFALLTQLFKDGVCARANIEKDMTVNDQIVSLKEQYNTRLLLILEEKIDFNQDQDYKKMANDLAEKIVTRYKGKVEYYQLMNEVTGVMYSKSEDTGPKFDAGYGLTVDQKRYNNIALYTKTLNNAIKKIDPKAKTILSGHWVLIDPVLSLVKGGVDVDIIGWNWGSGLSDKPGIKTVDKFGIMNIPQKVASIHRKFWLIEANKDDGSYGGKEQEQADYIKTLATAVRDSTNVQGYFHFTLTDTTEEGPAGALGLVTIKKTGSKSWEIDKAKPAFTVLRDVAAGK